MNTIAQLFSGELIGAKRVKLACGLTSFPIQLFDLAETLKILDLSDNQLNSLPNDFGRFKHLKILFLSNNAFTVFPEVLGECSSLSMIGFKSNQIAYISEKALPPSTRWLILTNNCIKQLPDSIGNCFRLEKLMLAGNLLSTLPLSLAKCENLRLLRIAANKLTELPNWLLQMPNLAWIALSGNPFCLNKNSNSEPPISLIHWDSLVIQHQLGEGASGNIYQAKLKNELIAVKIFKGEITSDGLPEDEIKACMLADKHPCLVNLLGKITEHPQGKNGLVFELIPKDYFNLGLSPSFETCTRDVFNKQLGITLSACIKILTSIAQLAYHLHQKGIVHGDLYAHNILVNNEFETLMGDFGAATILESFTEEQKALFEKIEVKAFGYLMDDLINLTNTENQFEVEKLDQLITLKNNCLDNNIGNRPTFFEIIQLMETSYL